MFSMLLTSDLEFKQAMQKAFGLGLKRGYALANRESGAIEHEELEELTLLLCEKFQFMNVQGSQAKGLLEPIE